MNQKDPQKPADGGGSRASNNEPRIPPPGKWSEVMDELFEEAQRDGVFDNLPGHGKPLKLSTNPSAPETQLAYQLLKDNDFTLPWIAERNDIFSGIEELRDEFRSVWLKYRAEYQVSHSETVRMALASGWRDQIDHWRIQTGRLNKLIDGINLKLPRAQLEIVKLSVKRELERAGAKETLE
jgi:hypothetical protein